MNLTRALLDTNIYISYLLRSSDSSVVARCVTAGILGDYTLLVAQPLLDELQQSIHRKPFLQRKITAVDLDDFLALLLANAQRVSSLSGNIPEMSRDAKDDYLIAYALAGQAEYLVTGNDDLLVLGRVGTLRIVTPRQFIALLETDEGGAGGS